MRRNAVLTIFTGDELRCVSSPPKRCMVLPLFIRLFSLVKKNNPYSCYLDIYSILRDSLTGLKQDSSSLMDLWCCSSREKAVSYPGFYSFDSTYRIYMQ